MLIAKNLHKSYGKVRVLQGIDLHVSKGEIVSIMGTSGVGKSTLLNILSSLDTPDAGEVWVNHVNIFQLKPNDVAHFRNTQMGVVFQFHNLLPEFTALENVAMPAYIKGLKKAEADAKALELMCALGIKDLKNNLPDELSGGQAQRVAMARALVNEPKIVFADEPSGSLDEATANDLHGMILELRRTLGQTFIISTHNKKLADISDRVLCIKNGVIE